MSSRRVAIYPASFDPITNGHLDLIERARGLFDKLIVAVAINVGKEPLFSIAERVDMVKSVIGGPGVEVDTIDCLLVDYARQHNAPIVIRGLRAVSDFDYEFEMAMMNHHMYPEMESVFLMASKRWFYVSASRIRELVGFGADVSEFVPPLVQKRLQERLANS
jgi:pantetheine-phosphate adenylyltransferase